MGFRHHRGMNPNRNLVGVLRARFGTARRHTAVSLHSQAGCELNVGKRNVLVTFAMHIRLGDIGVERDGSKNRRFCRRVVAFDIGPLGPVLRNQPLASLSASP